MSDLEVSFEHKRYEEAIKHGALAFFGDKYSDIVRVVRISDISAELCGGTHLKRTGEAGLFKIVSEGSVAAGIRRIEAVCGHELVKLIRAKDVYMSSLATTLGANTDAEIENRISYLLRRMRELEKENQKLKSQIAYAGGVEPIKVRDTTLIFASLQGFGKRDLGNVVDMFKKKHPDRAVIFIMSEDDGKVLFSCGVTGEVIGADDLVRKVGKFLGGGGGGRYDFAEGGGKEAKNPEEVLNFIVDILQKI
jgi:alanyl-tRNA synthetase